MTPPWRWRRRPSRSPPAACTGVATSIGGKPGPEAGLLRGKSPSRAAHVTHVDRLTDGIAAAPDDPPRTELTSLFGSPDAFVDLRPGRRDARRLRGDRRRRRRRLRAGDVRATASRSRRCGRCPRARSPACSRAPRAICTARGRYLRLAASGGDGVYAVAELSAAADCPPRWPPVLAPLQGTPIERSAATKAWAFAALAAAYVLAYRRSRPTSSSCWSPRRWAWRSRSRSSSPTSGRRRVRCSGRCSPRPRSSPPRSRSGWCCRGRLVDSGRVDPARNRRDTGVAVRPSLKTRDLAIAVGCPLGAKTASGTGRGGLPWRVARLI